MNAPPKLSQFPSGLDITPAEKIAFRLGTLLLSAFAVVALLPLVYLVASVLDLSAAGSVEMGLVSVTWLALGYAVVTGFFCEARPSPRAYIAVISSCAVVVLLWVGWVVFGLSHLH